MPTVSEIDNLSLSGKRWAPLPRIARTIPFGYKVDDKDPKTLIPVLLELEALEKAKEYKSKGYSLRRIADWLESATGRKITHVGLKKRLADGRSKRGKASTLKGWADAYKEALIKVKKWDEEYGIEGHEEDWENFFKEVFPEKASCPHCSNTRG